MPARRLTHRFRRTLSQIPLFSRTLTAELRAITPTMPRFIRSAAWFFIGITLLHVALVIAIKWDNPAAAAAIYQASNATHVGWGLEYEGMFGLLGAIAQFMIVATAAVMSSLGRGTWRHAAHAVLIGWSALWLVNMLRLASADLRVDTLLQAAMYSLFFGCTVARATMSPRRLSNGPPTTGAFSQAQERSDARTFSAIIEPQTKSAVARTRFGAWCSYVRHNASRVLHLFKRWARAVITWLMQGLRRAKAGMRAFIRAVREPVPASPAPNVTRQTGSFLAATTRMAEWSARSARTARSAAGRLMHLTQPAARRTRCWLAHHGVIPQAASKPSGSASVADSATAA